MDQPHTLPEAGSTETEATAQAPAAGLAATGVPKVDALWPPDAPAVAAPATSPHVPVPADAEQSAAAEAPPELAAVLARLETLETSTGKQGEQLAKQAEAHIALKMQSLGVKPEFAEWAHGQVMKGGEVDPFGPAYDAKLAKVVSDHAGSITAAPVAAPSAGDVEAVFGAERATRLKKSVLFDAEAFRRGRITTVSPEVH